MQQTRIQILVAALFFTVIAGLLLIRRFDTLPEEIVTLVSTTGSDRIIGEKFRRGEFIETKAGEHLAISIGNNIQIGIDERSRLELYRLFKDERKIRFQKGRIIIINKERIPLFIETNKTENVLASGSATLINYDYQQLVTIAPLEGSIQTHIKGMNEYMLIPIPISVNEKDPASYSKTKTDPLSGAKKFYEWFYSIIPPPNITSPS
ncbi:hypothetical protein HYV69_01885 [Candidatus Uhrbacteria bacterium]|nr:hypothetical protein [Candidatus Uhrbacteria bacterium]